MKTIAFFNNKGGVGKTSLVFHVAWMCHQLGLRVVVADLDPQANLTSMFLSDERLEEIWELPAPPTIYTALAPLFRGTGFIAETPPLEEIDTGIGLLPGALDLSRCEDDLSEQWPKCLDRQERAFRVITAFARLIARAGEQFAADMALIDVGPNLGAINRAALVACDHVVIPLGADLFSRQGLRNVGPTLQRWRKDWRERRVKGRAMQPPLDFPLPSGAMAPIGYVTMRYSVHSARPVKAYAKWLERMPVEYRRAILDDSTDADSRLAVADDPYCLAQLKDYRSLMPMAQESHKPMFLLRPADGAIGSHMTAVQRCYDDFKALTGEILRRCKIPLPN